MWDKTLFWISSCSNYSRISNSISKQTRIQLPWMIGTSVPQQYTSLLISLDECKLITHCVWTRSPWSDPLSSLGVQHRPRHRHVCHSLHILSQENGGSWRQEIPHSGAAEVEGKEETKINGLWSSNCRGCISSASSCSVLTDRRWTDTVLVDKWSGPCNMHQVHLHDASYQVRQVKSMHQPVVGNHPTMPPLRQHCSFLVVAAPTVVLQPCHPQQHVTPLHNCTCQAGWVQNSGVAESPRSNDLKILEQ